MGMHFTRCFLLALKKNLDQDYIGLLAAGIAFYFLLASFPALAAAVSLYGIFSDPQFVARQFDLLHHFLPPDAVKILVEQARSIAAGDERVLGVSFVISTALAIYSATKGVNALIQGLNIAYNLGENRSFIKRNFNTLLLTLVMMIYFLVSLSLVAILPVVIHLLPVSDSIETFLLGLRWLLLTIMAVIGLEIFYGYGPAWPQLRWRWFSKGSCTATILWLIASILFSTFVTNFGSYNETYGSLSAVVVLLLWFWMSALTILFGAEINASVAQQREVDVSL